jgi:hypothetical protein
VHIDRGGIATAVLQRLHLTPEIIGVGGIQFVQLRRAPAVFTKKCGVIIREGMFRNGTYFAVAEIQNP